MPQAPMPPQGSADGAPADAKPAAGPDGNPPASPDEKGAETAAPEPPRTNPRPLKPAIPANPEELKVRPDGGGQVRFNFQGQAWLDVLEWLARISDLSLDWQEVPADFLNLRTQRAYTVDEARDLINRHLLDRGFTLLKHGEVLSVVNIKKLDPSLVPRVAPEELDDRDPHEFVKVSFPLDSLTAETATGELKPMLSPNGRLTALKATNRIEALDAVTNLRDIRAVLAHEQTQKGRKRLVQQFPLQYTRAAEVLDQLHDLLGLDKKQAAQADSQNAQQMQQMQQMQQQLQQMQQQQANAAGIRQAPAVHLVIIPRENSIVATAPADQMAVIEEAIKLIDVPSSRSQSLLKNMNRMQIYRLASIDPEPIVKMLQEIGDLDPTTTLQIDKKSKAIIAEASLADHMTIRLLVKKLDGTDRKFEVIKLRRLEADYVAGTIEFMMGEGDKKKNQNQNGRFNRWMFGFMDGQQNEEGESRKFRVDADVEHNRLLLWANSVELEEINHLLVKLGELPGQGGNPSTSRVLDTIDPEEVEQLLERLRRTWPGVAPNPLEITPLPEAEADDPPDPRPAVRKKPVRDTRAHEKKSTPKGTALAERSKDGALLLRLVQDAGKVTPDDIQERDADVDEEVAPRRAGTPRNQAGGGPASERRAGSAEPGLVEDGELQEPVAPLPGKSGRRRMVPVDPPAIRIGRDPEGRMIISSQDTQALDQLEDLLIEIAPPRKDYKIFKLKYKSTWAYGVEMNLKDFFEEKAKTDNNSGRFNDWAWPPAQKSEDPRRLSKRRPLKFISDSDTNSILVIGADANQLKIIEELIALYDIPESKDSAAVRLTKVLKIKHSKARVIAEAVKEVYRDLLSPNDVALQNNQNQNQNQPQKEKPPSNGYTINYNFGDDASSDRPESRMKFKGLLSIGVDELSNTLVVSSTESLLKNVTMTVEALDHAAEPTVAKMRVMQIDRNVDAGGLQKRLKSLMTKPAPHQPQAPRQPQHGQHPLQNGQAPDAGVNLENQ